MQTSEDIPEEVDNGVQDEENGNRGRLKRGRAVRTRLEILKEGQTLPDTARRRTASPITTAWTPRVDDRTGGTVPKQANPSTTSSRPSFYIVGKALTSLNMSKLPKSGSVLCCLLLLLETHSLSEATKMVREEVKVVWNHHFGPKFIFGKEFGKEAEFFTDEKLKIIKMDCHIDEK